MSVRRRVARLEARQAQLGIPAGHWDSPQMNDRDRAVMVHVRQEAESYRRFRRFAWEFTAAIHECLGRPDLAAVYRQGKVPGEQLRVTRENLQVLRVAVRLVRELLADPAYERASPRQRRCIARQKLGITAGQAQIE